MTKEELLAMGYVETAPNQWRKDGAGAGISLPRSPATVLAAIKLQRVRQRQKPLMNNLETDCLAWLKARQPGRKLYAQAIKFQLANGVLYVPDLFCFDWPTIAEDDRPTAFEIKGPWAPAKNLQKLKTFASVYPQVRVILVWRDKGTRQWVEQRILP